MDDKSVTQAVEQRHRDAAADFPYYFGFREVVRKGMLDTDPLVQAFAKFEAEQLATRPDNRAEMEAALREMVALCGTMRQAIPQPSKALKVGQKALAALSSPTTDNSRGLEEADVERVARALAPEAWARRDDDATRREEWDRNIRSGWGEASFEEWVERSVQASLQLARAAIAALGQAK